jgi:hypothetical protein
MFTHDANDESAREDPETYFERLASQEEIYLGEVEEELHAILLSRLPPATHR